MAVLEKSFRKDLENFEYDSRNLLSDHKWDRLVSGEETKKFYEAKNKQAMSHVNRNGLQANPETTGQHGTMI